MTSSNVSSDIESKAIAVAKNHPKYKEIETYSYCHVDVMIEQKDFIKRIRLDSEERSRILNAIENDDSIVLVSFYTSNRQPESLSGGGVHFAFFISPNSFEVIFFTKGTWRS